MCSSYSLTKKRLTTCRGWSRVMLCPIGLVAHGSSSLLPSTMWMYVWLQITFSNQNVDNAGYLACCTFRNSLFSLYLARTRIRQSSILSALFLCLFFFFNPGKTVVPTGSVRRNVKIIEKDEKGRGEGGSDNTQSATVENIFPPLCCALN